jgi:hypothetical protein
MHSGLLVTTPTRAKYLNCLEKLRDDNVIQDFGTWYWCIDGVQSNLKTKAPGRLSK